MLDNDLKEQLKAVFAKLERPVTLVHNESAHANQPELLSMLEGVASASDKILLKQSGQKSDAPAFHLERDGKPVGINFRGIPGGHEFTSLILAILNADGKGKVPDAGLTARIRGLKGPVRVRTFMSLTCENCPDVVQALNQMALAHPDFHHETIDGAYAEAEIKRLGVQGVPSVVTSAGSASHVQADKMIHSGRAHFLDLLAKLEETFGTDGSQAAQTGDDLGHFDVVVAGGGPAGVSAAIYSVRKGLKTAILAEKVGGQVQETKGIENMVGVVYTEGPKLSEDLYKHLTSYPVTVFDRRRVRTITKDRVIHLEGGESLSADQVIITTGAKWRELNVPGEKEYLGRGVAYCPHCDGPFYKGKNIAVIGGGNSGVEAAIDLAGIAGTVTVFEFNDALKADQVLIDKLRSLPNTSVITGARTTELVGDGQKIVGIQFEDRATKQIVKRDVDGVFVQIGLLPNSGLVKETVELTKFGEIVIDGKGRTSVPGIYAAGDVTTTPYKQIVIAMGEGAKAALAAFEDRMRAGAG